jgi:dimethylargininase
MIALVRRPTAALVRCELTHRARQPIDVALAKRQHAAFCDVLRSVGATVVDVPPAADLPDAVFVEDTAVMLDELAVLARPGAPSRRPEVAGVAEVLRRHRPIVELPSPATLDGGDVLCIGRRLFVGLSSRTNAEGAMGLRRIAEPLGYTVREMVVERCLHLLSACSLIAADTVLVNGSWIDGGVFDGLRVIEVPASEPEAANTVRVGEAVIVSRRFPELRRVLEAHGLDVRPVDVSEFEKAEGGVSCLALLVST